MYKHQIIPFGKFDKHLFHNDETGNSFALAPWRGACLLDVVFQGRSILDAYQTPEELDFNRWAKNMVLFPFPNRLKNGCYQWQGITYQFPINDGQTNNALHGFAMDKPMELKHSELAESTAQVVCSYRDDGDNPAYPFPHLFSISFTIREPTIFEVEISCKNEGRQALPLGLGWHPYFRLSEKSDELELQLPPCELIGVDEFMIPTGKRYRYREYANAKRLGISVLDNCFALIDGDDKAEVTVEGIQGKLHYWQETGEGKFNFFQLFTPPYRSSFAIEPMSCNVDAFNNGDGLIVLEPGEQMAANFGFRFEAKPV